MADEPTNVPDPDADLIAYLDGELDGDEARAVESRLALDPAARAKAEAYKKTFDLLDYLPRSEPSSDFATRTLTRLQPVVGAGSGEQSGARPAGTGSLPAHTSSLAVRRSSLLVWLAAAVVAAVGGYAVHAALRPYLEPPARFDLDDVRVVESLPLYVGVDDLEFLRKLDDPDLFAPDPAQPAPPADGPRPEPAANRDRLIALFKSYPPARQQQLRDLDRDLRELPPAERDRLARVLESYAVWLDRLPDADRREVLAAPTAEARLEKVRQVREKAWRESLPARQREQLLRVVDDNERLQLVQTWREAERARREEWDLARRQWDGLQHDRRPWPFSDPALTQAVEEYIKTALKADLAAKGGLPPHCRLTAAEFLELKDRHDATARDGNWWNWFLYGRLVYRLSEDHPYLPEFPDREPITTPAQVKEFAARLPKKQGKELQQTRGKWPDFAVEVADLARRYRLTPPEGLGPARPGQFAAPLNRFLTHDLLPKLTPAERAALEKQEGKWPEYPRELVALARKHDLAVPGVTLPGPPRQWEKYYSPAPRRKE